MAEYIEDFAHNNDGLREIPRIYRVKEENHLPKGVL